MSATETKTKFIQKIIFYDGNEEFVEIARRIRDDALILSDSDGDGNSYIL